MCPVKPSTLVVRADSRDGVPLADGSVQCVVTSPPYYGLRDYGFPGQIGAEPTVSDYVRTLVGVFRDVRRVLRKDGVLWLNLGDSYNAFNGNRGTSGGLNDAAPAQKLPSGNGLTCKATPNKGLMGVPWRVALALQDDGWILRQDVIWDKPNAMPESTRDRCTKSHEYVFLFAKSPRYFFDSFAVSEPASCAGRDVALSTAQANGLDPDRFRTRPRGDRVIVVGPRRNARSVWRIGVAGFKGAHFAVFPPALVERCVLAGTSGRGACPACGTPAVRVVDRDRVPTRPGSDTKTEGKGRETTGNRDPRRHVSVVTGSRWEAGCDCDAGDPRPCVVLDPFAGSGTTASVCEALGRSSVSVEMSAEYAAMAKERLARPHKPSPKRARPGRPGDTKQPMLF